MDTTPMPSEFIDLMERIATLPEEAFDHGDFSIDLNGMELSVERDDVVAAKTIIWLFHLLPGDTKMDVVVGALQSAIYWITLSCRIAMNQKRSQSHSIGWSVLDTGSDYRPPTGIDFSDLIDWLNGDKKD